MAEPTQDAVSALDQIKQATSSESESPNKSPTKTPTPSAVQSNPPSNSSSQSAPQDSTPVPPQTTPIIDQSKSSFSIANLTNNKKKEKNNLAEQLKRSFSNTNPKSTKPQITEMTKQLETKSNITQMIKDQKPKNDDTEGNLNLF